MNNKLYIAIGVILFGSVYGLYAASEDVSDGHMQDNQNVVANNDEDIRAALLQLHRIVCGSSEDNARLSSEEVITLRGNLKQVVHAGKTDDHIRQKIAEQGNECPITLDELNINHLDQVVVLSGGAVVVHLNTIKNMIESGRTVRDPFTRERLSRGLIDYARSYSQGRFQGAGHVRYLGERHMRLGIEVPVNPYIPIILPRQDD